MKRPHSTMSAAEGSRTYIMVEDSPTPLHVVPSSRPMMEPIMEGLTLASVPPAPPPGSAAVLSQQQPPPPPSDSVAAGGRSGSMHQLFIRPTLRSLLAEGFANVRASQASVRRTALLSAARSLSLLDAGQSGLLVEVLLQQLDAETEGDIQSSLATLLSSLAIQPHVAPEPIATALLHHLHHSSGKVRAQVLASLQKIVKSKTLSADLVELGLESGLKQLEDDHHRVRREALLLVAHLTPTDPANAVHAQAILSRFTSDTDFRVRMAGFEGALVLHERNVALDLETFYWRAVHALDDDDYEEVRTQALHLVWVLSNMYSEHMVSARGKAHSSEMVRLVDDGFMKICNMVMDPSIAVRRLACQLLGSIKNVRTGYLLQTLSKEVISKKGKGETWTNRTARNQSSARNRSMPTVEQGLSYLPGTAIGEMELDMEDFVLSDSGAAGAFIHGLEDEFFEVRMAAVDSVCELSLRSRHLASRALEYMVDMFNDEIEDVRVNSIQSVHKILSKVDLKEEQIKMMQPILEEANESIRMAMYNLMAATKCPNAECLHETIKSLLQNMNRYPEDRLSIYQCLKGLGVHHGQFVELLVEPLLGMLHVDLRFLGAELHMEDSTYVALAIVILNAGADNTNVLHLLPSFVARHHRYFRDKYPALFPSSLPFPSTTSSTSSTSSSTTSALSSRSSSSSSSAVRAEDATLFLGAVLANVARVVNLLHAARYHEAHRLIRVSSQDLRRIAEVDAQRAATAEFYLAYLRCLTIVAQSHSGTGGNRDLVGELLFLSYRLEREFVGLDAPALLQILRLRLYARLLLFLSSSSPSSFLEGGKEDTEGERASLQQGVERLQRFCEERMLEAPAELGPFLSALERHDDLSPFSATLLPREPVKVEGALKRVWADWLKPLDNVDKPVAFPSSLYHSIHIEAILHNVPPTSSSAIGVDGVPHQLLVYVTLPDRTSQLWPLRAGDLKLLGDGTFKLTTTVQLYVNQLKWTEACNVKLDLVLAFGLDAPSVDLRHTTAELRGLQQERVDTSPAPEWKGPPTPADKLRCLRSGLLRLCPPHAYAVLPTNPHHPKK